MQRFTRGPAIAINAVLKRDPLYRNEIDSTLPDLPNRLILTFVLKNLNLINPLNICIPKILVLTPNIK